jgi:WD40 repeat protein
VTTSNSKNVIIWDAHSLAQLYVYNIGVTVNNAKFSKDGVMLAIGFSQSNLVILNANTYALISNSINTNHGVVY